MSETVKSNVQLEEQSITTSPEQAVNAVMPEQVTTQDNTEKIINLYNIVPVKRFCHIKNLARWIFCIILPSNRYISGFFYEYS